MSIQTIGSMGNILKSYDADKWVKSVDFKELDDINRTSPKQKMGFENDSKISFGEMLAKSISDVNKLQHDANTAIEKLATGKSKNIHETMLAVEKADIAFRTMNQIRLKVIDAYKEVMRMQV